MAENILAAQMTLDNKGFTNPLQEAQGHLTGMMSRIGNLGMAITGIQSAFQMGSDVIQKSLEAIKGPIDLGSDLHELSERTGVTVEDLMKLRGAFMQAKKSVEEIGPVFNVMQRSIAGMSESGEPTNKMFDELHINLDNLKSLNPAEQFKQIGSTIGALEDPAMRANAAMKIFGRSGGELISIFRNPDAMNGKGLAAQAEVMKRDAGLFHEVTVLFAQAGTKLQGFFLGVADRVAPVLKPLLEELNKIDLTKYGQMLGDVIGVLANAFKQGKLTELFSLSLQVGAMTGINYLVGGIQTACQIFGDLFSALMRNVFDFSPAVMDFVKLFTTGIFYIGATLTSCLLEAFKSPIVYFQTALQYVFQQMEGWMAGPTKAWLTPAAKMVDMLTGSHKGTDTLNEQIEDVGRLKQSSFHDLLTENQATADRNGVSIGNVTTKDINAARDRSGIAFKELLGPVMKDLADAGKIIMDDVGKFKPADIFDPSGKLAQLSKLYNSLVEPPHHDKEEEPSKGTVQPGNNRIADSGKREGDSLTKIGLFLGSSSPQLDHMRRTAAATEAIQKVVTSIQSSLMSGAFTLATTGDGIYGT